MTKIVLHGSRLSPFVEKAYRGLRYKGLDVELVELGNPLELRKLNPVTRKMPVALFDGERVYDSTFILRRAEELQPEPPFYAADAELAANQRRLEDWADESLYWMAMGLRWTPKNAGATASQILAGLPALLRPVVKPMVTRQIGGMTRAQGFGRLPEDVLLRELGLALDDLATSPGGRAFFWGERPGAADFAVYGQLHMLTSGPTPEAEALIADRPPLVDFAKRVAEASGGA
jgi:glutathione S-transferase